MRQLLGFEMLAMETSYKLSSLTLKPLVGRCFILAVLAFIFGIAFCPFPTSIWFQGRGPHLLSNSSASNLQLGIRRDKFVEVPQIVWGLNNQKIAFARACLTAKYLNRTLLMPSLSASLFYKEVDLLKPMAFEKIFHFEKFNSMCAGFVQLGRYSQVLNQTAPFELQKGSGRKWTKERDLDQLNQCREESTDRFEVIRIVGKHPFLWHDHWPVKDYSKIFECLVVVEEIENEAAKVISKIREVATKHIDKTVMLDQKVPFVAVHLRIEKDWMIHCKKLEQKMNINEICSSKGEITKRVAHITGQRQPIVVYLAVADSLLEDDSILNGWQDGLLPVEKKKLGVWDIYRKYPYLIQSAIDYEVCSQAQIFIGNSFSTFSSLIVLSRTQRSINMGITDSCETDTQFTSYAYNVIGRSTRSMRWMADMSATSLQSISYGTNNISCNSNWN